MLRPTPFCTFGGVSWSPLWRATAILGGKACAHICCDGYCTRFSTAIDHGRWGKVGTQAAHHGRIPKLAITKGGEPGWSEMVGHPMLVPWGLRL